MIIDVDDGSIKFKFSLSLNANWTLGGGALFTDENFRKLEHSLRSDDDACVHNSDDEGDYDNHCRPISSFVVELSNEIVA